MEYGKFNSAEELLKGYKELEKSFTQKCQQLAELRSQTEQSGTNGDPSPLLPELRNDLAETLEGDMEKGSDAQPQIKDEGAAMEVQIACAVPADVKATSAANDTQSPSKPTAEQIKQYLAEHPDALGLLQEGSAVKPNTPLPKVMASGGNVSLTLPTKPKTIKEASVLARRLFDGA